MHLRIYIWFCWISRWRNFKRFQIIDPIYDFQLDDWNQDCNLKIEVKREINKKKSDGSKIKSIDTFLIQYIFASDENISFQINKLTKKLQHNSCAIPTIDSFTLFCWHKIFSMQKIKFFIENSRSREFSQKYRCNLPWVSINAEMNRIISSLQIDTKWKVHTNYYSKKSVVFLQ